MPHGTAVSIMAVAAAAAVATVAAAIGDGELPFHSDLTLSVFTSASDVEANTKCEIRSNMSLILNFGVNDTRGACLPHPTGQDGYYSVALSSKGKEHGASPDIAALRFMCSDMSCQVCKVMASHFKQAECVATSDSQSSVIVRQSIAGQPVCLGPKRVADVVKDNVVIQGFRSVNCGISTSADYVVTSAFGPPDNSCHEELPGTKMYCQISYYQQRDRYTVASGCETSDCTPTACASWVPNVIAGQCAKGTGKVLYIAGNMTTC